MPYVVRADLDQRFGASEIDQLLDRNNDATEDSGALDTAIADTDALIDGYLAALYTLPVVLIPALLKAIACDIVRFKLWDDNAPTEVRKRYEDALKQLKDIANGLIKLPIDAVTSTNETGISYKETNRIFTSCTLRDF